MRILLARFRLRRAMTAWLAFAALLYWLLPPMPRCVLDGPDDPIYLGFSPDGQSVATTFTAVHSLNSLARPHYGPVFINDLATGRRTNLLGEKGSWTEVTFSADWRWVAAFRGKPNHGPETVSKDSQGVTKISRADYGTRNGDVYLWDLEKGREDVMPVGGLVDQFVFPTRGLPFAIVLPEDSNLREARMVEVPTGTIRATIAPIDRGNDSFRRVVVSPDGRMALAQISSEKGYIVNLWDITTGRLRHVLGEAGTDLPRPFAFSRDGRSAVTYGTNPECLRFWDLESGKLISSCKVGHRFVEAAGTIGPHGLTWSGPGNTVVIRSLLRGQHVIDCSADETRLLAIGVNGSIISPDTSVCAVSRPANESRNESPLLPTFEDYTVVIQRLPGGEEVYRRPARWSHGDISPSAFSPDGKTLAVRDSISDDDVWFGQKALAWLVRCAIGGRRYASNSSGVTEVSLLDTETGRVKCVVPAAKREGFRFAPDGQIMLVGRHIWDVNPGRMWRWILAVPLVPAILAGLIRRRVKVPVPATG